MSVAFLALSECNMDPTVRRLPHFRLTQSKTSEQASVITGEEGQGPTGTERVSRWVGLVLRLACEALVSVSCASRLPPVFLNRY